MTWPILDLGAPNTGQGRYWSTKEELGEKTHDDDDGDDVKTRLHGFPRLINAVESTKLNSTVERYCLHSSTKVNVAVDFKKAANELVCGKVLL